MSRLRLTTLTWLLLCASLLVLRISRPPERILSWDVFGYYLYLPATVIHHDPYLEDQAWLDSLILEYQPSATFYQGIRQDDGKWIIKYPMGMALSYAPWFFLAHGLAPALGYPADGMSAPYAWIIALGSLLYAFLGLWYLRKILLHFFKEGIAALTLLLIVAATNYLQLTAFDGTLLSHSFLFTLYALLIWKLIRWFEEPVWRHSLSIGLLLGLIILVRPSEMVVALIPLTLLLFRRRTLTARALPQVVSALALAALAGMPQLIYWRLGTGQWFYYSYVNPGEGFEFLRPYTLPFLFSFRKGWLIYTPLVWLTLAGFFLLFRRSQAWFTAILLFLVIDLWVVSSWTCWWYAGGSFSSRSMLPAYVPLAVPLGFFLRWAFSVRIRGLIIGAVLAMIMVLNLFQTWQFEEGIISKERMTRAYYLKVFGRTSADPEDDRLLLVERSVEPFADMPEVGYGTPEPLFSLIYPDSSVDGIFFGGREFSPGPDIVFHDLVRADHAWLRLSTRLRLAGDYQGPPPMLVAAFHHEGRAYQYQALPADTSLKGEWQVLRFDYLTPEVRSKDDNFKAYVWHPGDGYFVLAEFSVDVFHPENGKTED